MHKLFKELCDLNICTTKSVYKFHKGTRDKKDLSIRRCKRSGVIFLDKISHIDFKYYSKKNIENYRSKEQKLEVEAEAYKRFSRFKKLIENKKYLDIGCGDGSMLRNFKDIAREVCGVEKQKILYGNNFKVYKSISDVPDNYFDVISLFHVIEHFPDPLDQLRLIHNKLSNKGKLIIETPNAKDFLITFLDFKPFHKFTFWSEHLLLQTKESLGIYLKNSGFKNIKVCGLQRYPLVNHLYWLKNGESGGHKKWAYLTNPILEKEYERMLDIFDMTDTLIAIANK